MGRDEPHQQFTYNEIYSHIGLFPLKVSLFFLLLFFGQRWGGTWISSPPSSPHKLAICDLYILKKKKKYPWNQFVLAVAIHLHQLMHCMKDMDKTAQL